MTRTKFTYLLNDPQFIEQTKSVREAGVNKHLDRVRRNSAPESIPKTQKRDDSTGGGK